MIVMFQMPFIFEIFYSIVAYTYPGLDLHLSLDWDIPLHGFKVVETDSSGTQTFLCATTHPHLDPDLVRQIVHLKWGVESNRANSRFLSQIQRQTSPLGVRIAENIDGVRLADGTRVAT